MARAQSGGPRRPPGADSRKIDSARKARAAGGGSGAPKPARPTGAARPAKPTRPVKPTGPARPTGSAKPKSSRAKKDDGAVRLNKFIAQSGVTSRRDADRLIAEGKVKVNGRNVTELGVSIDPNSDVVKVSGHVVRPPLTHAYVILNKPRGVLTTAVDPENRRTVLDLIKMPGRRLFPVGRLDRDSEGLLLLTDDGELSLRFTHPRYEEEKEYRVSVVGNITEAAIDHLRKGVMLDDKRTLPAGVWIVKRFRGGTLLKFKLREGRNRQIRRMCETVGFPVQQLVRVAEGPLRLGNLRAGAWRELTPEEGERLRRTVGL